MTVDKNIRQIALKVSLHYISRYHVLNCGVLECTFTKPSPPFSSTSGEPPAHRLLSGPPRPFLSVWQVKYDRLISLPLAGTQPGRRPYSWPWSFRWKYILEETNSRPTADPHSLPRTCTCSHVHAHAEAISYTITITHFCWGKKNTQLHTSSIHASQR